MDQVTLNRLLELNKKFYQTFAQQFSDTRQRLQPGVKQIIAQLPQNANILDLGCGNGELFLSLKRSGYRGHYVGLDNSHELLQIAIKRESALIQNLISESENPKPNRSSHISVQNAKPKFLEVDLSSPNWNVNIPYSPFDYVLAFAVLHHVPGEDLRQGLLHQVHKLLGPTGMFIHSEWQFLNSPRLRTRIQPWETIELTAEIVDPGDYLLEWRHGGYGLRYVHHFFADELANLANECNFTIIDAFHSDGESGKLGLYQIWEKAAISSNEIV
ncbi:class I SAM-dependent methyltransferase [Chloroflexota bacterium]